MIRLAIADGDERHLDLLTSYLNNYEKETGTVFEITRFSCVDSINMQQPGQFDMMIMDVEMRNGLEAARSIRRLDPEIVILFLAATDAYAIQGYEVNALDYLLKPVAYAFFSRKLDKALSRMEQKSQPVMLIRSKTGLVRLSPKEIYYVESRGHYLIYVTQNGTFESRANIKDAEEMFRPFGFVRSNKGYLVNLIDIEKVEDGCCVIRGERLLISRLRKQDVMQAVTGRLEVLQFS